MYILGLTGPSGTGKSLAARHLEGRGFIHIDADKSARSVVLPGTPCLKRLVEVFGLDILHEDGSLNRKKLAEFAFGHGRVDELNAVTHPFIIEEIRRQLKVLEDNGAKYVTLDAPALFESGANKLCNSVMALTSPLEDRVKRIMKRDGLSLIQAQTRLNAQPDNNFYISRADFVIENNGLDKTMTDAVDRTADLILTSAGRDGV